MDLKPIVSTNRGKGRLDAALRIYRESILKEAQNPEKQIIYWIDHGGDTLIDEFRCFAIQSEREVIGYLQYSYFREENLFFFEYLCIRDKDRLGLAPSEALEAVEAYLAGNYPPNFSIVFEIAQTRNLTGAWRTNRKLVGYFTRLGFRRLEFNYRYPVLQSYSNETSYPADLMVRMPYGAASVSATDLRTILRCIYFKHYLRWDRPFLKPDDFQKRERLINELYSQQVASAGDNDSFGTTGDNRRSLARRFSIRPQRIGDLLAKIFGPKLPRLTILIVIMLIVQWILGSSWLLVPFVLAVAAMYCLAEDTASSRKLFATIISRLSIVRQRSS